ncbi:DNA cytosine methyltransferase [Variovorax sp. 22077]|uniref:DNA cytosine methyltransferase n=1 Tax=Variovorax sp. 22077 TaxID=3453867 RepID=UPI003F84AD49
MVLVDLFSGCGGFSLGAHKAGFNVAAAFDIDPDLTSSFSQNFPDTTLHLTDISVLTSQKVVEAAGGKVDGIFGGPPCQGFSEIGKRNVADPRRELLSHFFRLVAEVRPKFFVMENVTGLALPSAKSIFDGAIARVEKSYNLLGPKIWNAADFGAATNRRRLFVLGVRKDFGSPFLDSDFTPYMRKRTTVKEAIADLQDAVPLGKTEHGHDLWKIAKPGRPSVYAEQMRSSDKSFTGNMATAHTPSVIKRFASVKAGEIDKVGRHQRLSWGGQCPTLRAGTGSDKGSFQSVRPLHPDLPRVITVREAARLQGFPDSHLFHPTIWHSFRMIGNSVSPVISSAIFSAIARKFGVIENLAKAA